MEVSFVYSACSSATTMGYSQICLYFFLASTIHNNHTRMGLVPIRLRGSCGQYPFIILELRAYRGKDLAIQLQKVDEIRATAEEKNINIIKKNILTEGGGGGGELYTQI